MPGGKSLVDAVERGRDALRAGDRPAALRWLERASRLAPRAQAVTFLLASALAGQDNGRSLALFRQAAAAQPASRAVRIGLVAAALRAGSLTEALEALTALLLAFAASDEPGFIAMADAVCAGAAAPGWCGATADGRLLVSPRPGLPRRALRVTRGEGLACVTRQALDHLERLDVPGTLRDGVVLVRLGRAPLVGSGLDPRRALAALGCVELQPDGSLAGWASAPWNPDPPVRLTLVDARGGRLDLLADDASVKQDDDDLVIRQGFRIAATALPQAGVVRVTGPDDTDLAGSPVQLDAAAAGRATALMLATAYPLRGGPVDGADRWRPIPAPGQGLPPMTARRRPRRRAIDVVIPVFRGAQDLEHCLESLRRDMPHTARIVLVDDASTDPALLRLLDHLAGSGAAIVLRHAANRGFPAAANTGLRHASVAAPRDVLLLNPDTLPPPGLLPRLAAEAYSQPDIGSVTPLSNDGTLVSYPRPGRAMPPLDQDAADQMDAAAAAHAAGAVELPTGVGFCLYIRHDCLAEVGAFRDDAFAQGYGEENDWCLRARHLGWRHVAAPGVFVAHAGGRSFGAAKQALLARNARVLERLHPGYDALIAAAADPLAPHRRAIETGLWAEGRLAAGSVVLVSHALGGGVQRFLAERCGQLRAQGLRPVVVTPAQDGCTVADTAAAEPTNLTYALPQEWPALLALLQQDRPRWLELHHLLGHADALRALPDRMNLAFDVYVHDFSLWCPRVTLCGPKREYCGEPAVSACEACVQGTGAPGGVGALRDKSARLLQAARRVFAPSLDTAARVARFCPQVTPVVTPWERADALAPIPNLGPRKHEPEVVVLVPGAIGIEKGYDVLLGCGWDAAHRGLPLRFVVAGHTMDDEALMRTGHLFVTGEYAEHEAVPLMQAQRADLGFIPSVWPETWCYTLSELWRGGLDAVSFDLGAQSERIQRSGRGIVLPLGLAAGELNDRLIQYGRLLQARGAAA